MSKLQRKNLANAAVDHIRQDETDDFTWTGDNDFTGGSIVVANPTVDANPVTWGTFLKKSEREPVFVRAQTNVNLSAPGSTIDGETMFLDARVCCDQQFVSNQKGLYLWKGAAVPMVRTDDFAVGMSVSMVHFGIEAGTDAKKRFEITNLPGADVVGTDDLATRDYSGEPERITNLMSTGLLCGGGVSADAPGYLTFTVQEGCGYIVNNYASPPDPLRKFVQWSTQTGIIPIYILVTNIFYVVVDETGTILQLPSRPTDSQFRDYIVLAGIGCQDHVHLSSYVSPVINLIHDIGSTLLDFLTFFGAAKAGGNIVSEHGTDLRIKRSAGSCFKAYANYYVSAKTPNFVANPPSDPQLFLYAYRDTGGLWTTVGWTYYTDPDNYDPGGGAGLVAVPLGKFTIQYIFMYTDLSLCTFQYGQKYFDDMTIAEDHIWDSFEPDPDFGNSVFLGWLIIQEGTTDLSDPAARKFIPSGKWGLASMISGSTGGEANTASNIGTSGTGLYAQKLGVDLQFKNLVADSTKVSVVDHSVPHTVGLDVVPGNIDHQTLFGAATNTHSQIDSHISNVLNPHATTATQVGLGNVTNDAQIKATDFPAASVDSEVTLFSGTSGKVVKRASTTGILKGTAGVLSAAAAGTDYEAPIAAGTTAQYWRGDKTWQTMPIAAWQKNYVEGGALSRNATNPTYQIDIAVCRARSDDDTTNLQSTATITISLAASGLNGLDTGAEANSTWYYEWLIYNPSTDTYGGLFSLSSTSPSMPTGYTKKRRLGSWYNNSSGNLRAATMSRAINNCREYEYDGETAATVQVLNGGSATSFTNVTCSGLIAPTSTYGQFLVEMQGMSSSAYCYLRPNGSAVATPIFIQYGGYGSITAQAVASAPQWIKTDGSQIIQYLVYSGFGNATIWVGGYRELI